MSSTFDYNDYNDLNSGQRSNMRLFGLPYQFIDSVDKKPIMVLDIDIVKTLFKTHQ